MNRNQPLTTIPDFNRELDDPTGDPDWGVEVTIGDGLTRLLGEQASRERESLCLYEPMPISQKFHHSLASERVVRGGRRCLAGWQLIYDPVAKSHRRVDEIDGEFHVLSRNPKTGVVTKARACRPFVKGFGDIYRVTLSTGSVVFTTLEHRVVDCRGEWVSIGEAWQAGVCLLHQPLASEFHKTATTAAQTPVGTSGRARVRRRCAASKAQSIRFSSATRERISRRGARLAEPALRDALENSTLAPSGASSFARPRASCGGRRESIEFAASHPLRFEAGISPRTTTVTKVEIVGKRAIWDFEVEGHANYLCEGLTHANSGKTLSTMIELAWAVTGQHPCLPYPKENGVVILVGYKWTHIGSVFFPKLLRPGAFKMIIDAETGKYRAYRPWEPADAAREQDAKPAPQLIPARFVKSIAWGKRAENIFTRIVFTTGWEIWAYSSDAEPPVGMDVDLVVIDEDLKLQSWVSEMEARLSDRKGRLIWGTAPYLKNQILRDMCRRAKEEQLENPDKPDIEEFILRFRDNPHIAEDEKRKRLKAWGDQSGLVDLFDLGEFATDHYLRWPQFNIDTHGFDRQTLDGGQVPNDWCRYMVVDPGTTVCAVLFAVLPPPGQGDFVLLEGELYIRRCTAEEFGRRVSAYLQGKHLQASIIDEHGSRIQEAGSGLTVKKQYSDALKLHGVRAFRTRHGFEPGCDDIPAREMRVDSWLTIRGGAGPKLRAMRGELPNFEREIAEFNRKVIDDEVQEVGDYRRNAHLAACLGYLAAHDPKYVKPKKQKVQEPWAMRRFREKEQQRAHESQGRSIILGPQGARKKQFEFTR